jgi:RNA polymerase subunit RPABC4/transcription elongation factor Spt4
VNDVKRCPKCNNEVSPIDVFCPFCGEKILDETSKGMAFGTIPEYSEEEKQSRFPKKRSYFKWMMISIFTLGLGGVIYLFLTLDDLNKIGITFKDPIRVRNQGDDDCLFLDLVCFLLCGLFFYQNYYNYKKVQSLRLLLENKFDEYKNIRLNEKLVLIAKLIRLTSVIAGLSVTISQYGDWSSTIWWTVTLIFVGIFLITSIIIATQLAFWQKYVNEIIDKKYTF